MATIVSRQRQLPWLATLAAGVPTALYPGLVGGFNGVTSNLGIGFEITAVAVALQWGPNQTKETVPWIVVASCVGICAVGSLPLIWMNRANIPGNIQPFLPFAMAILGLIFGSVWWVALFLLKKYYSK